MDHEFREQKMDQKKMVSDALNKAALDQAAKEAEAAADTLVFQKKMVDDALDKAA